MDHELEQFLSAGAAHMERGQIREGEAIYRQGVARFPKDATLSCNLGVTLSLQSRHAEALTYYNRAIAADDSNYHAHLNRGLALMALNDIPAASQSLRRATTLEPNHPDGWLNLGVCLIRLHAEPEAIEAFERAVALAPNVAMHHAYLGQALSNQGRYEEGDAHYQRAIALDPNHAEYRMTYGFNRLRQGDFATGWALADARLWTKNFAPMRTRFREPVWDGSPLDGRMIYFQPEQGMGDVLQFVRYAKLVAQRGGRVLVGCQAPIKNLIATAPGVAEAMEPGRAISHMDTWIPLLSLPGIFKTELSTIPAEVPYLTPDPALVETWRDRLGEERQLRVGLVWAGNPEHAQDHHRSMRLEQFAPLAHDEIEFVGLQVGPGSDQSSPSRMHFTSLTAQLRDLSDTGAVLMNLDLLITVDTAPAHLAGALGREVWTLIHAAPDWRWMLGREDTPWYPTMKLYRQTKLDDWSDVIERVRRDLHARIS